LPEGMTSRAAAADVRQWAGVLSSGPFLQLFVGDYQIIPISFICTFPIMNKGKTIRIFIRNSGLFRDKPVNLCYNAIVHNKRRPRLILRKTNIFLKYAF
jgi:hypothetical protein